MPTVQFLDDSQFSQNNDICIDLAPDLLFNGPVELFGQDKIIDFPYLESKKVITGYGRDFFCITTDKDVENRNIYSFGDIRQLLNNQCFDRC